MFAKYGPVVFGIPLLILGVLWVFAPAMAAANLSSELLTGAALTTQIGQRLKNTTRKLADLTFIDVYGRIHRSLIQLTSLPEAMTHPDGMQIRVTRQELGKLVGCSREMAGRVLKMLEGDGYITVAGKTIVVLREPVNIASSVINS